LKGLINQVKLAGELIKAGNYTGALKVLSSVKESIHNLAKQVHEELGSGLRSIRHSIGMVRVVNTPSQPMVRARVEAVIVVMAVAVKVTINLINNIIY